MSDWDDEWAFTKPRWHHDWDRGWEFIHPEDEAPRPVPPPRTEPFKSKISDAMLKDLEIMHVIKVE